MPYVKLDSYFYLVYGTLPKKRDQTLLKGIV